MAKDNRTLGEFVISNLPRKPAEEVEFDLKYEIDANGILEVSAQERNGRGNGYIKIASDSRTKTLEEVEKMVRKADEMKDQDEMKADNAAAMSRLEKLCGDIRFYADGEAWSAVKDSVEECERWIRYNGDVYKLITDEKYRILLNQTKDYLPTLGENCSSVPNHKAAKGWKEFLNDGEMFKNMGLLNKAKQALKNGLHMAKNFKEPAILYNEKLGRVFLELLEEGEALNKSPNLLQATHYFTNALTISKKCREESWQEDIISQLRQLLDILRSMSTNDNVTVNKFCKIILGLHMTENKTWMKVLCEALMYQLEGVVGAARELLLSRDYGSAQKLLLEESSTTSHEKLIYLEENSILEPGDKQQFNKIKVSIEELKQQISALKVLGKIPDKIESLNTLNEDQKIMRSLNILDDLVQTKDLLLSDIVAYCEAKVLEGRVQLVLYESERAKACFLEVVKLGKDKNWTDMQWYMFAQKNLEELIAAESEKKKSSEVSEVSKETLLAELKDKMILLISADNISDYQFVEFVWQKFPLKHIHANHGGEITEYLLGRQFVF